MEVLVVGIMDQTCLLVLALFTMWISLAFGLWLSEMVGTSCAMIDIYSLLLQVGIK